MTTYGYLGDDIQELDGKVEIYKDEDVCILVNNLNCFITHKIRGRLWVLETTQIQPIWQEINLPNYYKFNLKKRAENWFTKPEELIEAISLND